REIIRATGTQFAKERHIVLRISDVERLSRILEDGRTTRGVPQALAMRNVVVEDAERAVAEEIPFATAAVIHRPAQLRTGQIVLDLEVVADFETIARPPAVVHMARTIVELGIVEEVFISPE